MELSRPSGGFPALNAKLSASGTPPTCCARHLLSQKLAKRLSLTSTGKREEIVERLKNWHREQRGTGQAGHFQSVQVRATPDGKAISPRLLSPLVQSNSSRPNQGILSSNREGRKENEPGTPKGLSERSSVLFSPYNMVKLIPSKEHSEMFGQCARLHAMIRTDPSG